MTRDEELFPATCLQSSVKPQSVLSMLAARGRPEVLGAP